MAMQHGTLLELPQEYRDAMSRAGDTPSLADICLVLERAPELGEIGAGNQLGPNAFHAFDYLGIGDAARKMAVFVDKLRLMDAMSGEDYVASLQWLYVGSGLAEGAGAVPRKPPLQPPG